MKNKSNDDEVKEKVSELIFYSSEKLGNIYYLPDQFKIDEDGYLRYIGPDKGKPIQPVGLKDYSYMFYKREDLTSIDLSEWDMSNVNNMEYMLYACTFLISF